MKIKTTATALIGLALLGSASVASAQTATANFSQGDSVIVALKVNVRKTPNGVIAGKQAAKATGTLVDGPINAAGYTWWKIDYASGTDGWTAEDFLQNANVSVSLIDQSAPVAAATPPAPAATSNVQTTIAALQAQLNALLAQISAMTQTAGAASSQ